MNNEQSEKTLCKVGADKFVEVVEQEGDLQFVDEHVIGVAKGVDEEVLQGLKDHFMGECTEVGMYLAMSRQADREGYPEIAEAFKRYAWEEAEHAAKFAELLGEVVWDTKTNVYKRMMAEQGACEDKKRIATRAKQLNLDAIHDTVHEMCKDEARHGKGFEGLYKRYFKQQGSRPDKNSPPKGGEFFVCRVVYKLLADQIYPNFVLQKFVSFLEGGFGCCFIFR